MNWMTSAKKRVSKANRFKSDSYKRANAYKKLPKASRRSFVGASRKDMSLPTTNRAFEGRADERLLCNLDESTTFKEGLGKMKASASEKKLRASDPFFDIQLSPDNSYKSTELATAHPAQDSTLKPQGYDTRPSSAISREIKRNYVWKSSSPPYSTIPSRPISAQTTAFAYKEATTEPIVSKAHTATGSRDRFKPDSNRKPVSIVDAARSWDLFEGDHRVWDHNARPHFQPPGADITSTPRKVIKLREETRGNRFEPNTSVAKAVTTTGLKQRGNTPIFRASSPSQHPCAKRLQSEEVKQDKEQSDSDELTLSDILHKATHGHFR